LCEKKIDVSDLLPFEPKLFTWDDSPSASLVDEVLDQQLLFQHVLRKLGGAGQQSSDGILWEPVNKKWMLVRPLANSRAKERRDERDSPIQTSAPPVPVRVEPHQNKCFSSYQYVPGESEIIRITTNVDEDDAFTYITVFDSKGNSLMPSTYVGPIKYDGMVVIRDLKSAKSDDFVATLNCDNALIQKERQLRETIESLQQKYVTLKAHELAEKKV